MLVITLVSHVTATVTNELSKYTSGLGPKKVRMMNLKVETTAVDLKSKTKQGVVEQVALGTTARESGAVFKVTA